MSETMIPPRAVPVSAGGARDWSRRNLFPGPVTAVANLAAAALLLVALYRLLSWGVLDAVWGAGEGARCATAEGACWSVIAARWRLIFFGLYPAEEYWRAGLASVVAIGMVVITCVPRFFTLRGVLTIWPIGFVLFVLLMRGGFLGLATVSSDRWGGLPLTLFIYTSVLFWGMPLAILIALARRSRFPVIRAMLGVMVDLFRSVPLLTVLFSFSLIIPFFLPQGVEMAKLYRVILGFALFFACYQSEIVRGGLQALPPGQDEAARALGLSSWQRLRLVVLPQVFRHSMPMTVNQFVVTFKDTAIILIVGLFEFMASAKAAFGTAEWSPYYKEVYLFAAFVYFLFCFSLTRYGRYLERRLRLGQAR